MINYGDEAFTIENGDRLAQMVGVKVESMNLISAEEISVTKRDDGGFGHSGIKD